ncbi:MAG: acylphosphatase [Dehalococcoidia bacterium]|nr:acylphosphatase [Dehalococcoidia bacterium]
MSHLSVKIYGRVQGVFFRHFVQGIAKELELKGYVCNLRSGDTVEVQAEGDKQELEKLIEQLKIGPPGAQIRDIETTWSTYSGQFTTFDIRYT